MTSLISSTRVEEGHHDRVTVWNRGGNAGTLTVQKGDGAEVAARLMDGELEGAKTVTISEERFAELVRCKGLSVDLGEENRRLRAQLQLVAKDRHDPADEVAELRGRVKGLEAQVEEAGAAVLTMHRRAQDAEGMAHRLRGVADPLERQRDALKGEANDLLRRNVSLEGRVKRLRGLLADRGSEAIKAFDDWNEACGRPWRGVEDIEGELRKGRGE